MSARGGQGRRPGGDSFDLKEVDQLALLGPKDVNLHFLEKHFGVQLGVRGDRLRIDGPPEGVAALHRVLEGLVERVRQGQFIDGVTLDYLCSAGRDDSEGEGVAMSDAEVLLPSLGRKPAIRAKTPGQRDYIETIRRDDVVFAVGPAGTGKTFLAVVMAMDYLKRQLVDRIVLVRPAVEAGEQLGFLPGDLQEKINPYLRPLFDALSDITGAGRIAKLLASGVIEASPLAYMRGRTLNNAFVILDEAQNTTLGQMKMFLTRLGFQSKAVVTGDITQIDLADAQQSGLVIVREILQHTPGIGFVELGGGDIVRHPLVQRIVAAFAEASDTPRQG